jgi:hypothetical protein
MHEAFKGSTNAFCTHALPELHDYFKPIGHRYGPAKSESGNTDEGQIWIGYKNATFINGDCQDVNVGAREFVIDTKFTEDGGAKPGSILNHGVSVHTRTAANKVSSVSYRVRWVDNDKSGNRQPLPASRTARASKG